ncbi:MAG: hypothetical protein ACR2M6_02605 [Vampirovibrionia bacterium]
MALQFVRGQLIDAIINADKLDASSVQEAKIQDDAVAFAKLKGADVTSDLQASATSSQIARADAIKTYVDDEIADLANNAWKDACLVSTTAQLAATYNNAAKTITATANGAISIDGQSPALGDRVLVRHDTSAGVTGTENCGIYNVTTVGDGSNPFVLTRATDMDANDEIRGSAVLILRGTENYGRAYYVPSFGGTLGTDNVVFERLRQFSAGDGIVFDPTNGPQDVLDLDIVSGIALKITSSELDLAIDGSTLAQSGSGIKVDAAGITATELNTSVAGAGISGGGGTALAIDLASNPALQLDGSDQLTVLLKSETGGTISKDGSGLFIDDAAISNAKLANSTISNVPLGSNLNALTKATNAGLSLSSYNGSAAVSDLALDITDLADGDLNVAADFIAFADADDGVSKTESVAEFVGAMSGNGLADTSGVIAVQADGSTLTVGGSGVKVSDGGVDTVQMADDSVTIAKLGILPSTDDFTANGATLAFTLTNRIAADQIANFKQMVRVFRNGQRLKPVASSPADASEYTVTDSGSATVVTLGANPANGEVIIVDYWYNA